MYSINEKADALYVFTQKKTVVNTFTSDITMSNSKQLKRTFNLLILIIIKNLLCTIVDQKKALQTDALSYNGYKQTKVHYLMTFSLTLVDLKIVKNYFKN